MPPVDLARLPRAPGCYLFRNPEGGILYIGKAKVLRSRVASYFRGEVLGPRIQQMADQVSDVEVIVTNNEVEALVLENNLIKHHQPKYNINLRDAKNYAYILLTEEEYPRIGIARRASEKGQYFGPFVSARERNHVLSVLKRVFRLRTCRKLPRRGCLRQQMGTCSAPCAGGIGADEYRRQVGRAVAVLRGETRALIETLRTEMEVQSAELAYERALEIREQIESLERLAIRQHVERPRGRDQDVIHFLSRDATVRLMIFQVLRGRLADHEEFTFPESEHFLEEFLVQYYSDREPPPELILPGPVDTSLQDFLNLRRGTSVTVTVPIRGAKRALLDLVQKNLEAREGAGRGKGEALQRALSLPEEPRIIECFDISHLSGTSLVGSLVRFRDGVPERSRYRRFRIRSESGTDDLAAMGEVVRRRYSRILREGEELPDLILVDGGRGQREVAERELRRLSLSLPVVALAKREEEIYVPGRAFPIPLSRRDRGSLYLQEIRNEAHRFAHAYHTLLRRKEVRK